MAACKGCIHDNVCNRDVGHGWMECPHFINTADVAPRAELAREIFEEIEKFRNRTPFGYICFSIDEFEEIKKKYTGEE